MNYPSGFSQLTPARRPSWLLAHCLEFLGPSTANRLTDKQVTLGVHCDRMQERELASHVTEAAETRQRLAALAVQSPNHFILAVVLGN